MKAIEKYRYGPLKAVSKYLNKIVLYLASQQRMLRVDSSDAEETVSNQPDQHPQRREDDDKMG